MMADFGNALVARTIFLIVGTALLIAGVITLLAGLLTFIGSNLLISILPKYIVLGLLPQDISFVDGLMIVFGLAAIITSKLFYTSKKWLGQNKKRGGLLAILLASSSLFLFVIFEIFLNLTLLGDVIYIFLLLFTIVILSVLLNWNRMTGGLEEVMPGVGYFIAASFVIFLVFTTFYMLFPLQLSSISSVGGSSFFSILVGSQGIRTVNYTTLSYSYPLNSINVNLTGLISHTTAAFSVTNNSLNQTNVSKLLGNTNLNILLPNSFILATIGNAPAFISNINSINISYYTKGRNASFARRYFEDKFPPLRNFYMQMIGFQRLNSTYNESLFALSPSKLKYYLEEINITSVNSSFPINITHYVYSNLTYDKEFGKYLPSQLLVVNMSNHVGINIVYNQSVIFNITRIPFYYASISLYQSNNTLCFEIGADFAKSQFSNFNKSLYTVQRTLNCK
jgi:hypothetical protein